MLGAAFRSACLNLCRSVYRTVVTNDITPNWYPHTHRIEWIADGVVHAIGLFLAIVGIAWLLATGFAHGGIALALALTIYAACLLAMLSFSALYNTNRNMERSALYARIDLAGIYLMIAGTYTPLVSMKLPTEWAVALLTFVWIGALAGVSLKLLTRWHDKRLVVSFYVALGWVAIIAAKPLFESMSSQALTLLVAGGLLYTVGILFHLWKDLRFNAAIWHVFVLTAAICHFMAIYIDVAAAQY